MCLGLATRTELRLPLIRLRAGRQMTEVRVDDLRFTTDEARAYLEQGTGLTLGSDTVATL